MLLLHRALLSVGGAADSWTPAELFAAAEVGAWYDPSDITTLYQTEDTSTPVTATGQSVGRMEDKSGNGKHLIQATSGNRPTWQQDGSGYYYLDFDGTNDHLTCASSAIPLVDLAVFIGFKEDTSANGRGLVVLAPTSGNDYEQTTALPFSTGDTPAGSIADAIGSAAFSFILRHTGSKPSPTSVVSMVKSSTSGSLYYNGSSSASATDSSFTAFSSTNSGSLIVGARYSGGAIAGNYLDGRIYGIIIRGASTTTTDRELAEDWLNTKTGAY